MEEVSIILPIKPLSVNTAWKGKRFKTDAYKKYEKQCTLLLTPKKIDKDVLLDITINYYFSSTLSDVDNPTKPLLDILVKKYGFDDRQIYRLLLLKNIVKKGSEKIEIKISKIN